MHQTIDESQFIERFDEMNRGENFSIAGRRALFESLEELERNNGLPIELDVIALCCEFNESDLTTINREYGQKFDDLEEAQEWLDYETFVVGITSEDTIVYQAF